MSAAIRRNSVIRIALFMMFTIQGPLVEGITSYIDLKKPENVKRMEQDVERTIEKRVSQLIKKVQSEYGTDIFGLDETVIRKNPSQWKKRKNNWKEEFQEADVLVDVDLTVELIGLTGEPQPYK